MAKNPFRELPVGTNIWHIYLSYIQNRNSMFGLFRKKDPLDELQKKYEKTMAEVHKLSHVNRKKADLLMAEADHIARQIEALKKAENR